MSVLDWFSREKREQRAFDKALRNVLRKTRAKDERMDEPIHYLSQIGTDEALDGLLRRFDVIIQSESMDRYEKELIHDLLIDHGTRAIDPIRRYLRKGEAVTWPIQALRSITTEEQMVGIVLETLEAELQRDSFKPDKRVRMLQLLRDHDDERVAPVAVEALRDFDETVRYAAVELLLSQGDQVAREPLLAVLTDDEEDSGRIKKRILAGFVENGWTVKGFRKAVEALLTRDQWIDRQGKIKQKGG